MFSRPEHGKGVQWVWLLVPFGLVAAATLSRFDGLYGQDSYAYYGYATGVLRDFLMYGEPFPAFFWPPGYPLLVTLTSFVVGKTPLAGQIVSLAAATLVPLFTYLLAKELRPDDKTTPFAAALLVALTGQLWQSAVVVMTDTTGLAFATGGMWAVARYGRTQRGRWLILAAATLAYALLTRWAYGLVAIPATVYALYVTFGGKELRGTHGNSEELRGTQGNSGELREQLPVSSEQSPVHHSQFTIHHSQFNIHNSSPQSPVSGLSISHSLTLLSAAAFTVSLIMSPVLYALLTGQKDPATGHTSFTGDLGVVSWNLWAVFQREFVTADGLLQYRFPTGLFYALTPAFPYYFTPLLAWLIFPGLWIMLKERAAASLFLIIGWAGITIGFLMGASYQNFRFSLVYLPPLAIAAAVGFVSLSKQPRVSSEQLAVSSEQLPVNSEQSPIHHSPFTIHNSQFPLHPHAPRTTHPRPEPGRRDAPRITHLFFATGLLLMVLSGIRLINTYISNKDRDLATVTWVENQTEPDSNLICFGLTATFQQYSRLHTYEIYHLNDEEMVQILSEKRATYALLDTTNINQQWSQLSPGRNWQWLQDHTNPTPIGQTGEFTLYLLSP